MKAKIYKALDSPSSIFGIQTGYIKYMAGGIAASAVLGIVVTAITLFIVGLIASIIGIAATYGWVTATQAKRTSKEQAKVVASRQYPHIIHVRPQDSELLKNSYKKRTL